MMGLHTSARLPSIRELELACSRPTHPGPSSIAGYGTYSSSAVTSPTYSQLPSPKMPTPVTSGSRASADRAEQRHTSTIGGGPPEIEPGRPGYGAEVFPAQGPLLAARSSAQLGVHLQSQKHPILHHPPFQPQIQPPQSQQLEQSARKRPHMATPPRSPDSGTPPNINVLVEASLFGNDEVSVESRRLKRESKERRRRRDQRSLTVRMEQSIPAWVFGRLKTRHSASKVNGGGRATNAVMSGVCIWLRVQDRAMKEGLIHWSLAQYRGQEPTTDRWMQLVDEEASSLEKWGGETNGPGMYVD